MRVLAALLALPLVPGLLFGCAAPTVQQRAALFVTQPEGTKVAAAAHAAGGAGAALIVLARGARRSEEL